MTKRRKRRKPKWDRAEVAKEIDRRSPSEKATLISQLTGTPVETIPTADVKGPCLICGGETRMSLTNQGKYLCHACGARDLIALVMELRGESDSRLPAVLDEIAQQLGLQGRADASESAKRTQTKAASKGHWSNHLIFNDNWSPWLEHFAGVADLKLDALLASGAQCISYAPFGLTPDGRPKGQSDLCIGWPVYGKGGKITGYRRRLWSNLPIGKNGERALSAKGSKAGIIGQLTDLVAVDKVIICEGETDMVAVIGALNDSAVAVVSPSNGAGQTPPVWFADELEGKEVVIIYDRDKPGDAGSKKWAKALCGKAVEVKRVELPYELKEDHGSDVRDYLKGHSAADLRKLIQGATAEAPTADDDDEEENIFVSWEMMEAKQQSRIRSCFEKGALPRIEIVAPEWPTTKWVMFALSLVDGPRAIYQRGGQLVQTVIAPAPLAAHIDSSSTTTRIGALPKCILRERIQQACNLFETKANEEGDDEVPSQPPPWLINAIHERGQYPEYIRPVDSVATSPTLRRDGSVLQDEGYDAESRLIYVPSANYPRVSDIPSRDEAIEAASRLLDLVSDFPFSDDAHRSAWLSLLLTMIARPSIDGPCPLFLIDANTRGSGKSMLADICNIISYGAAAARRSWPRNDEEVRKSITSIVLDAMPAVLFDNIETGARLGGASLDAALTGTSWTDRILGKSETVTLPLTQIWIATGNNVALAGDTARRTMYCRLDSQVEHPEDRTRFRYPQLLSYVKQHRCELAVDAATIMRAWHFAGKPKSANHQWGSFEAWNDTIPQVMVWLGLANPMETRQSVREADSSSEQLSLLHAAMEEIDPNGNGVTAAEIERLLGTECCPESLRQAIAELVSGRLNVRKIGAALRRYKGRVLAGRRLEQHRSSRKRQWYLDGVTSVTHVTSSSRPQEIETTHLCATGISTTETEREKPSVINVTDVTASDQIEGVL